MARMEHLIYAKSCSTLSRNGGAKKMRRNGRVFENSSLVRVFVRARITKKECMIQDMDAVSL
jgi:hypothetical protein